MKKVTGKLFVLLLTMIFLLGIGGLTYFGIGNYYKDRFSYGIWVNGIYCTGKTVAEVNQMLIAQTKIETVQITDNLGEVNNITSQSVGLTVDYSSQLEELLYARDTVLWTDNLQQNFQKFTLEPEYVFDAALLTEEINRSNIVLNEKNKTQDVVIMKSEEGYQLLDSTSEYLDVEKMLDVVAKSVKNGDFAVNLAETGCYKEAEYTAEMLATMEFFEKIDSFQNTGIIYDMGDSLIEIGPQIASQWIMLDENGEVLLDSDDRLVLRREGIEEFINQLADEYDTYASTRTFQATRGESIQVTGGIYGNQIDRNKEIAYLTDAVLNGIREVHIPSYLKEAHVRGKNDIGDTYIEIDMTAQKMYYYEDGVLLIETDVVTGSIAENHDTPSGVNYVYGKSRNVVLRGKDYESFVKYWMPVKGGIGIHDASWRKKFGGEIYLKNGSHGCINTPLDAMKELYKLVEVGTPVVMFY